MPSRDAADDAQRLAPLSIRLRWRLAGLLAHENSQRVRSIRGRLELVPSGRVLSGLPEFCRLRFSALGHDARKTRLGSSVGLGARVHRQVEHWVNCQRDGTCTCAQQRVHGSPYRSIAAPHVLAQRALEALRSRHLVPVRAEIPLLCESAMRGTKLDLLCARDSDSLVLVSLKTGTPKTALTGQRLRPPFQHLEDTETNVHMLQLLYEKLLLERDHGTPVADALVLYLLPGKDGPGYHWRRLPDALLDRETQRLAYECLCAPR